MASDPELESADSSFTASIVRLGGRAAESDFATVASVPCKIFPLNGDPMVIGDRSPPIFPSVIIHGSNHRALQGREEETELNHPDSRPTLCGGSNVEPRNRPERTCRKRFFGTPVSPRGSLAEPSMLACNKPATRLRLLETLVLSSGAFLP